MGAERLAERIDHGGHDRAGPLLVVEARLLAVGNGVGSRE